MYIMRCKRLIDEIVINSNTLFDKLTPFSGILTSNIVWILASCQKNDPKRNIVLMSKCDSPFGGFNPCTIIIQSKQDTLHAPRKEFQLFLRNCASFNRTDILNVRLE